jgi:hypothetical protein
LLLRVAERQPDPWLDLCCTPPTGRPGSAGRLEGAPPGRGRTRARRPTAAVTRQLAAGPVRPHADETRPVGPTTLGPHGPGATEQQAPAAGGKPAGTASRGGRPAGWQFAGSRPVGPLAPGVPTRTWMSASLSSWRGQLAARIRPVGRGRISSRTRQLAGRAFPRSGLGRRRGGHEQPGRASWRPGWASWRGGGRARQLAAVRRPGCKAQFVWQKGPTHGPPHTRTPPPGTASAPPSVCTPLSGPAEAGGAPRGEGRRRMGPVGAPGRRGVRPGGGDGPGAMAGRAFPGSGLGRRRGGHEQQEWPVGGALGGKEEGHTHPHIHSSPPPGTYPGRGPRWAARARQLAAGPRSVWGGSRARQLAGSRKRPSPRSAGSRASLQGPVCMGKRPDARTTPYKTTPLGIAFAPPNVCTPLSGPTEAGGTMWKVKGELSSPEASASFPARQAASPRPVVVRFPGIAPRPRWQPPAAGDGRPPSGARPRPRRPKPGGPLAAGTDGVCGSLAAGQRFRPDSRGEPPCDIRCSPACSRGPVPPPEARMPQPASAREGVLPGSPACGPVSWGAQWGQLDGRARVPGTPGASPRPEQSKSSERTYSTCCPSGGFRARPGLRPRRVRLGTRYLVDSASSHMLVSKIKPCMSKYKQFIR